MLHAGAFFIVFTTVLVNVLVVFTVVYFVTVPVIVIDGVGSALVLVVVITFVLVGKLSVVKLVVVLVINISCATASGVVVEDCVMVAKFVKSTDGVGKIVV